MNGSRVLVTGGAGFIGSHVAAALLARGADVLILDIAPLPAEAGFLLRDRERLQVERGAANELPLLLDAVQRFEATDIVHLAAIGDPAVAHRNPYAALRVNVEGTVNVLEAARLRGVRRVVAFSSIGVLPTLRYEPIDAAHPLIVGTEGPGSGAYGASKVAGEAFCFAYQQSYGVDFAVIRPSAVYGLGMRHPIFIKPMVEGAVRGEPVRIPSGGGFPRDYTHVTDIAELTVAALTAERLQTRIFFGATGGQLVTGSELAQIVRNVEPGADIEIADALTDDDRLELPFRGRLSIEPNVAELHWRPRYAELREGVTEYAAAYRSFRAGASA